MKSPSAMLLVAFAFSGLLPPTGASALTPVSKVLELLSGLRAKVVAEGEAATKTFEKFSEWCEDRSKNLQFEISTGKASSEDLKAAIEEQTAVASSLTSKLERLAASLAADEADLAAATKIRSKEAADFAAEEKELNDVIETLGRAIGILEREARKGVASALQLRRADGVAQVLGAMVHASMLNSADAAKLAEFVQTSRTSQDQADMADDVALGAPAAAVYTSHSDDIVQTLENLLDQAQEQLSALRQKETSALHNYELLKQSLEDEIKFSKKDTSDAKKGLAENAEKKAAFEGGLAATSAELEADVQALAEANALCMQKAEEYEASKKSRDEEIKALSEASRVISEATGGAESLNYGLAQASFLQVARAKLSSPTDVANFEVVRFVRDLAHKDSSPALAQLAMKMANAMRSGANAGDDPFAKVKGLISDMIERLEGEASADASHKQYCDTETAASRTKISERTSDVEQLSTKIDQMSTQSTALQAEVTALRKALSDLASSQAEMNKLRQEEQTAFVKNKAEMEQGIEGVKLGLKILREYYATEGKAHEAKSGGAETVVGLLEVVESDFSKGLSEMVATEESSKTAYAQETKENEIEKAAKEKDVSYKEHTAKTLDKSIAELTSDRAAVQTELDAVEEYFAKLQESCVAKPEVYEERAKHREAETAGLKEALNILDGEASLLQKNRRLRVARRHEQKPSNA